MRIITLILLLTFSLLSEIFILSYRVSIQDNRVIGEKLTLSPIMVPMKFRSVSFIEVDSDYDDTNRYIIRSHKDEVLEFLFKNGIHLDNQTKISSFGVGGSTITTLLLPPTYIAIDRTKNFTLITLLNRII